jgi:hypothetical protein
MDVDTKTHRLLLTRDVTDTWIYCPDFEIRPIQKHNATTWMLGHMLGYIHNKPKFDYGGLPRLSKTSEMERIFSTPKIQTMWEISGDK